MEVGLIQQLQFWYDGARKALGQSEWAADVAALVVERSDLRKQVRMSVGGPAEVVQWVAEERARREAEGVEWWKAFLKKFGKAAWGGQSGSESDEDSVSEGEGCGQEVESGGAELTEGDGGGVEWEGVAERGVVQWHMRGWSVIGMRGLRWGMLSSAGVVMTPLSMGQ